MMVSRHYALSQRDSSASPGNGKQKATIIVVSIGGALLLSAIFYLILRNIRFRKIDSSQRNSRKSRSWRRVFPSPFPRARLDHPPPTSEIRNVYNDPEPGVDRHTSVRSVATLPAYSAVPRAGEGVMGREGERSGMDTVVEFPETTQDEEDRREEEMVSLWRIRERRRRELAEREERRRRRREARASGDLTTLTALRHESMLRRTMQSIHGSTAMITEHNSKPRERRVSAVNYGDLGVARHDGSRVRANSNESDSRPLLEGIPLMSGPGRPWMSRESFSTHHHAHSSTSVLSMSSFDSDERSCVDRGRSESEAVSPRQARSRPRSRAHSAARSLSRSRTRSLAQILPPDVDLTENPLPIPHPPRYDATVFEEAPPYEPTRDHGRQLRSQAPQLPAIQRLPSIHITGGSPIDAQPQSFYGMTR